MVFWLAGQRFVFSGFNRRRRALSGIRFPSTYRYV
jgi:hypothetical protein